MDAFLRFLGANNQRSVHKFLFKIAQHYKERKNAIGFLTDLLKVKTPEHFAVCQTDSGEKSKEDDTAYQGFVPSLQSFIVENELKHQLLSHMKEIMVRDIY